MEKKAPPGELTFLVVAMIVAGILAVLALDGNFWAWVVLWILIVGVQVSTLILVWLGLRLLIQIGRRLKRLEEGLATSQEVLETKPYPGDATNEQGAAGTARPAGDEPTP